MAPMQPDKKRHELEKIRYSVPPHTYNPLRGQFKNIFNISTTMFGPVEPTPWSKIADEIMRRSRHEGECAANLSAAQALYDYAIKIKLSGSEQDFLPLPLGQGAKLVYWLSAVLIIGETPLVPFVDPRGSSTKLTPDGRRFVLSVMNERIKVADHDFAEVRLGIFQFRKGVGSTRIPVLHTDEGVELFDFETLDQMVRETYELWEDVCRERTAEMRRRTGTTREGMI
jgi:hypothetical protein